MLKLVNSSPALVIPLHKRVTRTLIFIFPPLVDVVIDPRDVYLVDILLIPDAMLNKERGT